MHPTLQTYIIASFDIMEEHFRICQEAEVIGDLDKAIIQAYVMKKQLDSLIDYLEKKRKWG